MFRARFDVCLHTGAFVILLLKQMSKAQSHSPWICCKLTMDLYDCSFTRKLFTRDAIRTTKYMSFFFSLLSVVSTRSLFDFLCVHSRENNHRTENRKLWRIFFHSLSFLVLSPWFRHHPLFRPYSIILFYFFRPCLVCSTKEMMRNRNTYFDLALCWDACSQMKVNFFWCSSLSGTVFAFC